MTHSTTIAPSQLDELCINTLRFLAVDMVQKANSGHPGLPLGTAAMAYTLWDRFLKVNPSDPRWPDRDRFVLSPGHGSALLYALLHVTGFDLPLEEIKRFRQWGSKTPGHPEFGKTPGVEATTGPLGQGFGNAVGMAIAETALAARYNRPGHVVVDHYTYVIASDGDLMEGVSSEAASLAEHLRLGKLIALYADNFVSLSGSTDLIFTENRLARFAAYGWHTQRVENGNDAEATPLRNPEEFQFDLDLRDIAEVWRRGSAIASWLLDLTASALLKDPTLAKFAGRVSSMSAQEAESRFTPHYQQVGAHNFSLPNISIEVEQ